MKTAVIYHEVAPGVACADGICSAWVAKKKYPEAELIGAMYGKEPPNLNGFDRVLIVDFSFPLEILQQWQGSGLDVLVIDHHKTAMNDLAQFENAVFNMDESGATLTWRTLFPDEPMPIFLEYVRDRDLWNFELPKSEEIHEAMAFIGRKFYQLDQLAQWSAGELLTYLAPLGEKLLEPKRKRVAEIAATAHDAIVKGYVVKTVEVDEKESRLTSDVCSAIYKANPQAAFVVSYSWKSKDEMYGLGFRSDKNGNDFDVSAIAKQFGGGGHRNASGANVEDLKELFECQFIVTYDNGSGYREWSCTPHPTPKEAIAASGGLQGFGEPRVEMI